jgi:hypothetical protein
MSSVLFLGGFICFNKIAKPAYKLQFINVILYSGGFEIAQPQTACLKRYMSPFPKPI